MKNRIVKPGVGDDHNCERKWVFRKVLGARHSTSNTRCTVGRPYSAPPVIASRFGNTCVSPAPWVWPHFTNYLRRLSRAFRMLMVGSFSRRRSMMFHRGEKTPLAGISIC